MHPQTMIGEIIKNIHSEKKFNNLIKYERVRSDRNNEKFSIITYTINDLRNNNINILQFIKLVSSKIRISDEIGWFHKQTFAVFLPSTNCDGAAIVAEKISMFLNINGNKPLPCNIYMYPSLNWILETSDYHGCLNNDDNRDIIYFKETTPYWKRTFDIIVSSLLLLFLSPLFFIITMMIKVLSPGPVFFKQARVGKSGKVFTMFKFRTMKVNNDNSEHHKYLKYLIKSDQPMIKLDDDHQLIPYGKILRYTSIDELPQLINVIRGEMSIVGPRPCIPYEAEEFMQWHSRRFNILPGLTGLWQINGKNKTTFQEMIRYDIQYSMGMSLLLDLKILLKTPLVVRNQLDEFIKKQRQKYIFQNYENKSNEKFLVTE